MPESIYRSQPIKKFRPGKPGIGVPRTIGKPGTIKLDPREFNGFPSGTKKRKKPRRTDGGRISIPSGEGPGGSLDGGRRLLDKAKKARLAGAASRAISAPSEKKYKGKYIGPDKYKGKIPKHLKSKYKGKYFGKEGGKGRNE